MVTTKTYTAPPISKKEILRYAGCINQSKVELEQIESLLGECIEEILPRLSYKVCYEELPISITDEVCDFGCMQITSKDLAKNLYGCEKVFLFAATIGVEIDRLIAKYGHLSQVKAVLLQAIGAERIESLCDAFCNELQTQMDKEGLSLRPRFSPGYGDLSLDVQKDIFQILNCSKYIGLTLNESLLMSPSKSVTAFVGVGQECTTVKRGCVNCDKQNCAYRKDTENEEFR